MDRYMIVGDFNPTNCILENALALFEAVSLSIGSF